MNESTPALIVVGVNGSQASAKALRWAAAEAAVRGCAVEAVSVTTAAKRAEAQAGYVHLVDKAAGPVTEIGREFPSVHIRHRRTIGAPARNLVRAAHGAAMLVVGSRRAGALMRILLGSVSAYCARHANCPVVIVSKDKPVHSARPSTEDLLATPGPLL
jgi:nucleotide-binding universal stress UspA family protein